MPDRAHFVANTQEMFRLQYTWSGMVGQDLNRRLNTLEFRSRMSAGNKTGALRASQHTQRRVVREGLEGRVGSELRYAAAHHQGARPHVIRARNARFLRFTVAGRVVFRSSVRHPGNRPNPHLTRWLQEAVQ